MAAEIIEMLPIHFLWWKHPGNSHTLKKLLKIFYEVVAWKPYAKTNKKNNSRVNFRIFSMSFLLGKVIQVAIFWQKQSC